MRKAVAFQRSKPPPAYRLTESAASGLPLGSAGSRLCGLGGMVAMTQQFDVGLVEVCAAVLALNDVVSDHPIGGAAALAVCSALTLDLLHQRPPFPALVKAFGLLWRRS